MSSKPNSTRFNNISSCDAYLCKSEEKQKFSVFDNVNINNLDSFYNNTDSLFKKRVDKLNIRFYLETDKFLNYKAEMDKSQDNLFLVLFKQLSLYVEEIERLNIKLKDKEEQEKLTKNTNKEDCVKKEVHEKDISYYKSTIRSLEKKLSEKNSLEEKMKKENESYKRQIVFYKDKLRLELSYKKNNPLNGQNFSPSRTTSFKSKTVRSEMQKTPRLVKEDAVRDNIKEDNSIIHKIKVTRSKKRIVSASCERIEKDELSSSVTQAGDNGIVTSARTKRKTSCTDGITVTTNGIGAVKPFKYKHTTQNIFNKPRKFAEKFITNQKTKSPNKITLNSSMIEPKLNLSNLIVDIDNQDSTHRNDKEYKDLMTISQMIHDNMEEELLHLEREEEALNKIRGTIIEDTGFYNKDQLDTNGGAVEARNKTDITPKNSITIQSNFDNARTSYIGVSKSGIKNKKTSSSLMKK